MEESFDELADESRISVGELMREISNARPACGDLPLRRARFGNSGGAFAFCGSSMQGSPAEATSLEQSASNARRHIPSTISFALEPLLETPPAAPRQPLLHVQAPSRTRLRTQPYVRIGLLLVRPQLQLPWRRSSAKDRRRCSCSRW